MGPQGLAKIFTELKLKKIIIDRLYNMKKLKFETHYETSSNIKQQSATIKTRKSKI